MATEPAGRDHARPPIAAVGRILLITALTSGCSAPTSLLLDVDLDPGFVPVSQQLHVSIPGRPGVSHTIDAGSRAITVLLPDTAAKVTVELVANDAKGNQLSGTLTLQSIAHRRVEETLCVGHHCRANDLGAPDLSSLDLASPGADLAVMPCGGPSRCSTAGVALCEDFESGALGTPFHLRMDSGTAATFDSSIVCRGARAFHLRTPAVASAQQVATYLFETQLAPASTLFVRAFLYAPSQAWPAQRATLFEATQSASPYRSVMLDVVPGGSWSQTAEAGAIVTSSPSTSLFPVGRWVCAEWEIVSAGDTTGALHLWLDGALVSDVDLNGVVTQPSPPLDSVIVGLDVQAQAAAGALDLWIDEVAIDSQRIGCAR